MKMKVLGLALLIGMTPQIAAAQSQDHLAARVKALEDQLSKLQSSLADRLKDLEALKKANEELQAEMKLQRTKLSEQASRISDSEETLRLRSAPTNVLP